MWRWLEALRSWMGAWQRRRWMAKERMPAELRSARLVLNEQRLHAKAPVPLSGQPDQVYELLDGELVIVDSKRRTVPRVYVKDAVQLSVNRVLVMNAIDPRVAGKTVKDYGYIRAVAPSGQVTYRKVRLAGQRTVIQWWCEHSAMLAVV